MMTNDQWNNHESINQQCSCFNLRKVSRALTQFFDSHLEHAKIRSTQFTLLIELSSKTGKTLTEIANNLVMDRTTLSRNLKPLEKNGLITFATTVDKRTKTYVLTDSGHALVARALPAWQQAQDAIINALGADKFSKFLYDMDYVLANIPKKQ